MHQDVEGIMTEHTLLSVRTKTTSIHHTELKGERRMLDQISQWVGFHTLIDNSSLILAGNFAKTGCAWRETWRPLLYSINAELV